MKQGENSSRKMGYTGPMPPPGHGVHHYHFQLFALDAPLDSSVKVDRDELLKAMGDRIALMDSGALKGIYAPAEFLRSTDAFVQPYVTAFRAGQQILNSGA